MTTDEIDYGDERDAYRQRPPLPVSPLEHLAAARKNLGPLKAKSRYSGIGLDSPASMAMAREMTADYRKRMQTFACPWPNKFACEFCEHRREECA